MDEETAWERVGGSGRPLARDRGQFGALYDDRVPVYEAVAHAEGEDAQTVVLSALGIAFSGDVPVDAALIADERVAATPRGKAS